MGTNDLMTLQHELPISRKPSGIEPSIEIIRAQKTGGAAFTLACSCSGLEDKEIYSVLGIDAGYFSNIKKGQATLKDELVPTFCEIVGNRVYPEWRSYQIGCTLVEIETETMRQLRLERERRHEAERENELMRKLLQGKA